MKRISLIVLLLLVGCFSPIVDVTSDAQSFMDENSIVVKSGKVFHNDVMIGKFILSKEELEESGRAQTTKLEFWKDENLFMRVTDSDGTTEEFNWNGERFVR